MLKKKEYNSLAEVFEEMVEEDISKRAYDLYTTRDGDYHCRECTFIVPYLQNCPHCKKIIDWTKIILSIEGHIIELLKGDNLAIADKRSIKEYQVKVGRMPDQELMSLYERLYDNLDKQDVALIVVSNREIRRRFLEAGKFLRRWFNRQQYEKWNNFIARIEAKATKFALEKIQKQK